MAQYGKAFAINEVKLINKDEFVENNVSIVEANFKDDIISTHHFSANNKIAAVDFCRRQRLNSALSTPTQ